MKTYKYIISCIAVATLLCCTACTDKWDEHYDDQPGVNGSATETLWQLLQQNDDWANFAKVCEATPFRTTETNKPNGYTFANLLGKPLADGTVANVTLTVYAPVISDEQCDSILNIINSAPTDSLRAKAEWQVQTQFLGNHIRRNRCDIKGSASKLAYMFNSKIYMVNDGEQTINGVKVLIKNLSATNGILHGLESTIPFQPNIHEYLRSIVADNEFANFIVAGDSSYFVPRASIEGDPDEYGRITYVDSVFFTTNNYFMWEYTPTDKIFDNYHFKTLGINLAEEDSMFLMIIPSSEAYRQTVESYRRYYRYGDYYENTSALDKIINSNDANGINAVRVLPNVAEEYGDDASIMQNYLDQLQLMRAQSGLMRLLTFNINMQYKGPRGEQAYVIDAFDAWKNNGMVDSVGLVTINNDTLRCLPFRPAYRRMQYDENGEVYGINWDLLMSNADQNREAFDPRDIFQSQTPVRMSNGLVYHVDNFVSDSRLAVHQDFIVEAENLNNIYQRGLIKSNQSQVERSTASIATDSVMRLRGYISNGFLNFMGSEATGTGMRTVTFKLPKVLSAKYDIYLVTVPDYYQNGATFNNRPKRSAFTATLNYVDQTYAETNRMKSISTQQIAVDSSRVQTVLLFEDFEFPCSYAGLTDSYPTLTIQTRAVKRNTEDTNNLCIDMIYLKAKD